MSQTSLMHNRAWVIGRRFSAALMALAAILMVVVALMYVISPKQFHVLLPSRLVITAQGHQADYFQAFYDVGHSFRPKDSWRYPFIHSTFQRLILQLPHRRVYRLRLDPGTVPDTVRIARLCLKSVLRSRCWSGSALAQRIQLQPHSAIKNVVVAADKAVVLTLGGGDPHFLFTPAEGGFAQLQQRVALAPTAMVFAAVEGMLLLILGLSYGGYALCRRRRTLVDLLPGLLRTRRAADITAVLLLVALASGIFSYTVGIRSLWFGVLSDGHHQWLTGSALKFSKNWYRDGAVKLDFLMLERPRSIETPTIHSRHPYLSYPPGTVIPIYLLARLTRHEPSPPMVMDYNLATQLFIALTLGLLVYGFFRSQGFRPLPAFLFGCIPEQLYLLLPAPLYWHQNVFFSDQAVMPYFALFIALEVLAFAPQWPRAHWSARLLQAVVMFLGVFTDWFFIPIVGVVFFKRLVRGQLGRRFWRVIGASLAFGAPGLLALFLFWLQLHSQGGGMWGIFYARAGLAPHDPYVKVFWHAFWEMYITLAYGVHAIVLLWGSLAVVLLAAGWGAVQTLRRRPVAPRFAAATALAAMLLVPCFIQVYILRDHSSIHDFSALKFAVPVAVVVFCLMPFMAWIALAAIPRRLGVAGRPAMAPWGRRAAFVWALGWWGISAMYVWPLHYKMYMYFPLPDDQMALMGHYIDTHTNYNDVLFSTNYAVTDNPPQRLSYTMKLVHKVDSLGSLLKRMGRVQGDFKVVLFEVHDGKPQPAWLRGLLRSSHDSVSRDGFTFARLSPAAVRGYARAHPPPTG